jgi:16S rRNA (cytosine967-C5)-methyltransferase
MSKQKHTSRTLAAQISYEVIYKKNNLSDQFVQRLSQPHLDEIRSAVKALCYETIRYYLNLEERWLQVIDKKPKDKMVRVIITQAMAEFLHMDKPAHAVVNEAINTAKKLNKRWASGLINSALRKAIAAKEYKPSNEEAQYAHPQWLIDKVKNDLPNHWQQVLQANNNKPPLWVRSNDTKISDIKVLRHPDIKCAYKIQAQDVTQIAEFKSGKISVQDASAQLAAIILNPQNNEKILDACAAPGGKTCHILELNQSIELDALELYPNRAKKITENLQRLNLTANVIVADATQTNWNKGKKYNKILIDAPCSASGIIRRHPDIKFKRTPQDFVKICQDQAHILANLAQSLEVNGNLLYATCSVFQDENSHQIELFLKTHPEFKEIKLKYPFATNCKYGIQILSGTEDMDGFYYCYLEKTH